MAVIVEFWGGPRCGDTTWFDDHETAPEEITYAKALIGDDDRMRGVEETTYTRGVTLSSGPCFDVVLYRFHP